MGFEIERKFLVKDLPSLENYRFDKIIQAYVSLNPEIRVRKKGERYFITEKSGDGIKRQENEREITEKEFICGFDKSNGRVIEKTRYYIPYGKYTIELDIYSGKHTGLIVAEVEFESLDEAKAFTPPVWFAKDVSNDINYRNKTLSQR